MLGSNPGTVATTVLAFLLFLTWQGFFAIFPKCKFNSTSGLFSYFEIKEELDLPEDRWRAGPTRSGSAQVQIWPHLQAHAIGSETMISYQRVLNDL
jgi:hypothetical protein